MENEEEFIDQDEILEVIDLPEQGPDGAAGAENEDDGVDEAGDGLDTDMMEVAAQAPDNAVTTFGKHMGQVFSVDICLPYAACGGEDDRAYIWKLDDGNVVFECTGHTDSVTYVRFNARKTMLATADMAGLVQVWQLCDFQKIAQFQTGDLEWLHWHHAADILFCGDADGTVWMYLVPNGDCKVYSGYGHPCSVGELFPDGKRLAAGYADGGVRIWDLKAGTYVNIEGGSVHKAPVTCIDVSQDNALVASGSEEGTANLIHANSGKIITTFICAKKDARDQRPPQNGDNDEQSETEDQDAISVEAIAFSKVSPALFTGTVNGEIAIWDLNTHVVRQSFPTQDGIVKAIWVENCILVADLAGVLQLYDSRNGALVKQWTGHKAAILDFCISTDSKILASSSADHTCKIFKLEVS